MMKDPNITLTKEESFKILEKCEYDKLGYPILSGLTAKEAYHATHLFTCVFPESYSKKSEFISNMLINPDQEKIRLLKVMQDSWINRKDT
jgi:hypothetical protein